MRTSLHIFLLKQMDSALKIEGGAITQLFAGQTLYIPKQAKTNSSLVFNYDGENNKYILMLFWHNGKDNMPPAQRPFLEKILEATKLSFKDVALANYAQMENANLELIKNFFAPSALFLWGITPATFGITAQPYQPIIFNKMKVICVDAIEVIEKDKALKGKLWDILKTHFL